MSCLINSGLTKDCNFLLGGLKEFYIANITDIEDFDVVVAAGVDLGKADLPTMLSSKVFYKVEFEKGTANFTNELTVSNGQKYVTQSATLTLAKQEQEVLTVLSNMSLGRFTVIGVTATGKRFVLGRVNGLEASAGSFNSGGAEGDFAGVSVTFTGAETEYSRELVTGTIPV